MRLNSTVVSVAPGRAVLADGQEIVARAVVVATDGPTAHELLGDVVPDPGSRAVACCWLTMASAPLRGAHVIDVTVPQSPTVSP